MLSHNVILNVNLRGRWVLSDSITVAGESMEIQSFTKDLAGVYHFYVTSWSRSEELAIQIELSAIGKSDTYLFEQFGSHTYTILYIFIDIEI